MKKAGGPASQSGSRRSAARLAVVQALYQAEATGAPAAQIVEEFMAHRLGGEIDGATYHAADPAFFAEVLRGTLERRGEIDDVVGAALVEGWPLERVDSTLRAILRAGAYELMARTDVPGRVVISEYVDIAHAFFAGPQPGFVNGVLDRLGHDFRPGELGSKDGESPAQTG